MCTHAHNTLIGAHIHTLTRSYICIHTPTCTHSKHTHMHKYLCTHACTLLLVGWLYCIPRMLPVGPSFLPQPCFLRLPFGEGLDLHLVFIYVQMCEKHRHVTSCQWGCSWIRSQLLSLASPSLTLTCESAQGQEQWADEQYRSEVKARRLGWPCHLARGIFSPKLNSVFGIEALHTATSSRGFYKFIN